MMGSVLQNTDSWANNATQSSQRQPPLLCHPTLSPARMFSLSTSVHILSTKSRTEVHLCSQCLGITAQAAVSFSGQRAIKAAAGILLCIGTLPLLQNVAAIRRRNFDAAAVKHAIEDSMKSIGVCLLFAALFA